MTEDKISERIDQLRAKIAQLQADVYVHQGALQDCEYWLEQVKKEPSND